MAIDKTKLTGVEKVYPLHVSPYEQYMGDFQNPSVVSKLNAMLQSLHQMGRLTNETVSQWNNVMKWIVDGGMDEIAETVTNEKVSVALNEVMRMLDVSLDNGLEELAEKVTDTKIDVLLKSGQFESMVSESLAEINEVVEGKLEGFANHLEDKVSIRIFETMPSASELPEGVLGLILPPPVPIFPFNYLFEGANGQPWDTNKFANVEYQGYGATMDKVASFSEILNNQGHMKVVKTSATGLASVENKASFKLDFTGGKKKMQNGDSITVKMVG